MTQAVADTRLNTTRLISLLSSLTDRSATLPRNQVAQGLGRMIDLPDSISIADTLDKLPRIKPGETGMQADPVLRLQRGHAAMIKTVTGSLSMGSSPARITLGMFIEPAAGKDGALQPPPDYQAYLKLHAALQRDLDFKARTLQADIRKCLAQHSRNSARLAAIDGALAEPIARRSRALFAKIPGLLQAHFQAIAAQADVPEEAVQQQLSDTLQTVLLAEIEARLLPALGLIEALEEEVDTQTYE